MNQAGVRAWPRPRREPLVALGADVRRLPDELFRDPRLTAAERVEPEPLVTDLELAAPRPVHPDRPGYNLSLAQRGCRRQLELRTDALRRANAPVGLPQRCESCGQELNPVVAVRAAFAEKLARQIRLCRDEQLVDPVVDLAEETGARAGTHAESMPLLSDELVAEGARAYLSFTEGGRAFATRLPRPLGSLEKEETWD